MDFKNCLGKRFIIFDGAMGTMLQQNGFQSGDIPEELNLTNPQLIQNIHKEYIKAGADIITTNTFGANSFKLKHASYSVEDIITNGVKIAKKSAKNKLVALDIGPIGSLLEPLGNIDFNQAYEIFKQQVICGSKAGADLILIETICDIYEAKAAVLAAKENCSLPVICTMTFDKNGRTLTGTDPLTMVTILQSLGVDALGVNCSFGSKEILPIVEEILKYSTVPVIAQPNAGLPTINNGEVNYDIDHEEFARYIQIMAQKGASIFGGCCGTNPQYINQMKNELDGNIPIKIKNTNFTSVASSTHTIVFDDDIRIVGERINPTGKEKLEKSLSLNDFSVVIQEAAIQKESGADILDINVGLPSIDEVDTMIKAIKEIQKIVDIPLQIDSINPRTLEKAARIYNGKPIINSVNGKKEVMKNIFPIVKKYGACVIGLTLDEGGIPSTGEDRAKIAKKIIKTAEEYGISKKDIIIDCLALSAATNQSEVIQTLKAIKIVKEKYGVKTILGISNISYGFPHRQIMNREFLSMALTYGLDIAIIDPTDKDMLNTISAFRVLTNKDKNTIDYLKSMSVGCKDNKKTVNTNKDLKDMIIMGLEEDAYIQAQTLIKQYKDLELVDKYVIPALDIVGEEYETGNLFLPQLIQSAKTVKRVLEVVKKNTKSTNQRDIYKGQILLATVEGDIHDIGKNIVKMILENHGYNVIDMGIDVPIQDIIDKINYHDIKLVGLSALTTTTVKSMKATIKKIKKECSDCKVMVGGAVLNEEYAKTIMADFFASNAKDAVKVAQQVF